MKVRSRRQRRSALLPSLPCSGPALQITNDLAMYLTPIDRIAWVGIHLLDTLSKYLPMSFGNWNLLSINGYSVPERQDVL